MKRIEIDQSEPVTIVIDDAHDAQPVWLVGKHSGISVYLALRHPDFAEQPHVGIDTERAAERFHYGDGTPILSVHLNDAELYDDEGDGAT
jgi:hypothetical protein